MLLKEFVQRSVWRYAAAFGAAIAALLLQRLIEPHVEGVYFIFPLFSIFLVARFCGFRPSLLAILTCALGAHFLFAPPRGQLDFSEPQGVIRLSAFVVFSLLVAWLIARGQTEKAESQKSERLLAETAKNLEAALRARDEFLSISSHELKTPLTALRLSSQIVKLSAARGDRSVFEPARVLRVAEQTDRQVTRLAKLVDDLLDVSRIQEGKLRISQREADVSKLVREVVDQLRPTLEQSASEIRLSLCPSAPAFVDEFRIEQVVTNLLTNAARYGGRGPIEIGTEEHPGFVRLCVRDYGVGIAKEEQEKVFQRYERGSLSKSISGLGLGLYIAKQIVEAHGGRIQVESEPGRGSTFIVDLPEKAL